MFPRGPHAGHEILKRRSEVDDVGRLRSEFYDAGPIERGNLFGYDGLNRVVADSFAIVMLDQCTWTTALLSPPE